ncbi:MAG: hypothetical protein E7277_08980 [Lachnospiraceae bacterium]|nr:hypothetical protein [Lachnospiraceae bacterium]
MTMPYIPVIGTDCRLPYLADALSTFGYEVTYIRDMPTVPRPFSILVLGLRPTPAELKKLLPFAESHGLICAGLPSKEIRQLAESHGLAVYDYMKDPTVAIRNGDITAEGALALALTHSPLVLQNTPVLVIGCGRCGAPLAKKCHLLGANVTVCEKNETANFPTIQTVETLAPYRIIFNTVPYLLLTAELLATAKDNVLILDLASAPGGTDFTYCKEHRIHAMLCPSLPARFAPQTAGQILAESIHTYLCKAKII